MSSSRTDAPVPVGPSSPTLLEPNLCDVVLPNGDHLRFKYYRVPAECVPPNWSNSPRAMAFAWDGELDFVTRVQNASWDGGRRLSGFLPILMTRPGLGAPLVIFEGRPGAYFMMSMTQRAHAWRIDPASRVKDWLNGRPLSLKLTEMIRDE